MVLIPLFVSICGVEFFKLVLIVNQACWCCVVLWYTTTVH
jgi:hypothetical protein